MIEGYKIMSGKRRMNRERLMLGPSTEEQMTQDWPGLRGRRKTPKRTMPSCIYPSWGVRSEEGGYRGLQRLQQSSYRVLNNKITTEKPLHPLVKPDLKMAASRESLWGTIGWFDSPASPAASGSPGWNRALRCTATIHTSFPALFLWPRLC